MDSERDKYYDEGVDAQKSGNKFSDCPYSFENSGNAGHEWSQRCNAWFHGWLTSYLQSVSDKLRAISGSRERGR